MSRTVDPYAVVMSAIQTGFIVQTLLKVIRHLLACKCNAGGIYDHQTYGKITLQCCPAGGRV